MGIEREREREKKREQNRRRRKFLGEFHATFRMCNVPDSTKLGNGKLQVYLHAALPFCTF
jgi:HSP20 family molecular chaperone IbpA